ncbi:chloramphenicol phosphotransferase [Virgibacillus profundi]|uniref:Chloramphenicol phosphotransferase n=1 Tax=Virgibacillus profundi TaxID=2024555 RepID=A0A2A2I9J4_9BACI|nr:chloramphenicol phosphotransferase [Virgibacillus profundi]PAV27944.1 chloramphenicol phosphotransferase [Virgibacillus profundi]PXY52122.1 chloramphenicol phosphotransferase [Virgibacillus profundi]
MSHVEKPGKIVILNGTPRSGKSSIAAVIQNSFKGVWMNLGVDQFMKMTPKSYQPGIGLRPGAEHPDLEPLIVTMYHALYESIAIYSHLGLNVVVDVGHHDGYSVPRDILKECSKILNGPEVLFVGIRCPIDIIMERRKDTWNRGYNPDGTVPRPVRLWQELVHVPGIYDLEVDTSILPPEECARIIYKRLNDGPPPSAFRRISEEVEE